MMYTKYIIKDLAVLSKTRQPNNTAAGHINITNSQTMFASHSIKHVPLDLKELIT